MMKRSKKGFTLVELIICCVIMTMLAGACTALLMSGEKLFSTGSQSAITQMDVSLLQTSLLKQLPSTQKVDKLDAAGSSTKDTELFFNDEGVFTIRHNGKDITIHEISSFNCTLTKIGESQKARTQFSYVATCKDGTTYSGGMALSTMKFVGTDPLKYYLAQSAEPEADYTEASALHFSSEPSSEPEAEPGS